MSDWHLDVDGQPIPVTVHRSSRRRTIALKLRPGPALELRAPRDCPHSLMRDFLDARRGWVRRHLANLPPPRPAWTYEPGEAHPFLGRDLALAVNRGSRRKVTRRGDELAVTLPSPDRRDHVAALVQQWYSQQAERVFAWRLRRWLDGLSRWALPTPSLRRQRMRRRWGSCTNTRVIKLNTHLVEREIGLIDYVLVHELCHLRELNHSPRFYRLMDAAMPDWRQRSAALDGRALD
jgi:predicted metal-dependent hydrolase